MSLTPPKFMKAPDLVLNTGTGRAIWIRRNKNKPNWFDLEIRSSAGMLDFIPEVSAFATVSCLRERAGDLEALQFMEWFTLK